jgi:site-specific recombinase XerD
MSEIILYQNQAWLQYFDRQAALAAVAAHIATLPSSRTDEKHTRRAYQSGLQRFLSFMGDELPTRDRVQSFIAQLVQQGLKSSTIGSKYLAPMRHYLINLADQHIEGLTGDARDLVSDCREDLRKAAKVPTPKSETTTNVAPLWRPEFVRLSVQQVNAVLRQIDRSSIAGLRDYALLHMAFSTGLRLAEIARVSLSSIQPMGDGYLITVRGKRSNVDPVPISAGCYADIMAYVAAFNDPLDCDDPRLIQGSIPLWQPLHKERFFIDASRYNPRKGMSHQGIRDVIAKRSRIALGKQYELAPHDTRRTAAAIAYDAGMPITDIQQLLRHKDSAVTMHYIGNKPNYHERALSTYVQFG